MLFRNFYRCARCDQTWTDVWSATCDDDCPHCGARHMSPYKSEDIQDDPSVSVANHDGGAHAEER
jgi:DNA-directed RNA polymerase subunit RPC12/RpoP